MQEGISYLAGAELPCVIVDIVRAGPGLGNIGPEQSDYFALTKGGGHGCYRNIVLAPASVQEMASLTMLAFELADKYRNPAVVLADGFVGQMMEPVELDLRPVALPAKPWAVRGTAETRQNLITSIYLNFDQLEGHVRKLEAKYKQVEKTETRCETYMVDDADILLVGYGIVSRVLRSTVDHARACGIKVGLLRPITLFPFPSQALAEAAKRCVSVLVVELSTGQMVEDVRLAVQGAVPVELHGRAGGNVPSVEEVYLRLLASTSAGAKTAPEPAARKHMAASV
jgi:pyruvate/2-oxoacid:ferredoxin oxidoreductase alpha subunit